MIWKTLKGVLAGPSKRRSCHQPVKWGVSMAKQDEVSNIDQLVQQIEQTLAIDYEKKDLKAQRELIKQTLYDGSKKLKHSVPKGKRI